MDPNVKAVVLAIAGLFGANVGSFLNVCIYRMPRDGLSVHRPRRSFCPSCGTGIQWYDNIPLVSWLWLGGRCRYCGAPVSMRYFLVEGLTAALFMIVALRYLGGGEAQWAACLVVLVLVAALIVASFIDLELRILPDEITLGGMYAVPLIALFVPDLHTQPVDRHVSQLLHWLYGSVAPLVGGPAGVGPWTVVVIAAIVAGAVGGVVGLYGYASYWRWAHPDDPKRLRDGALAGIVALCVATLAATVCLRPTLLLSVHVYSLVAALLGMFSGAGLVFGVGVVGTKLFRKPAMGFGDVKLMGLLGGFTGWSGVITGFFLACLLGSVVGIVLLVRYRSRYLPFGPFLAVGAFIMLLFPNALGVFWAWWLTVLVG